LPEVYEIASKAYIDLGDLDRAHADGRASLEFLPESALLLVPLANAEVKAGRVAEAEQSAKDDWITWIVSIVLEQFPRRNGRKSNRN